MSAVNVGLVGAGPWASGFHAPMLAGGPETRLAGVWARRPEAARALAGRFATRAFEDYGALLDACEAVSFAVPPEVQAPMAIQAARAGRALLLEKPLAADLAGAMALVDAIDTAGVPTQLMLTRRFRPGVRDFVERARAFDVRGAYVRHITDELFSPSYLNAWRERQGILLDFGFHALDLADAAAGGVKEIGAVGDPHGFMALTCLHEGGVVSQISISGRVVVPAGHLKTIDLYGPAGTLALDCRDLGDDSAATRFNVRSEFASAIRSGRSHPVDAHHGLYLQRLLTEAAAQLGQTLDGM
ncbi:Gfo/Idh/MocA family oxidoreductase [Streptosporangiaceae bacterium NEAU-GS5]|nr:Gfo/Idh/MocA family oxidoreductase [Streptosporangiaceae bacterium NEAU-GS5]